MEPTFSVLTEMIEKIVPPLLEEAPGFGRDSSRCSRLVSGRHYYTTEEAALTFDPTVLVRDAKQYHYCILVQTSGLSTCT